ncbi:uncharacterized protein LOC127841392 isoform X3 [Dreissena polymorpha]|uniref:uncharacterized protein LOC127841392 isoform X3 n=1 Tax=Dreissena polymorpha TaxID=45954 RepID=UPI002264B4A4|nr:uncharacterized protein LOC127841392 isoform X3 [Dreissena polymorpha]
MASLADVFKDKERTNWLKAWLAIDIAKSGLEHFADNEAQNFHQHIYSQVTSTLKSPLSTCTSCTTDNVWYNKQCPMQICNKVCQEINNEHLYNNNNKNKNCWSWKNTSAKLWQTNYWEIAKCYFPPDGYAATSSIQDTDFNGVVSFLLNCKRFDSKFSFPITKGTPTQRPACLLYEAREIGKAVRHSSVMKVTDVELQDYFTTLSNLLSDSRYLSGDSDAQNAVMKLEELEKDTLLLTTAEMMCLLEAADATLKQHLKDVAKDAVDESANDLRVNTTSCIDEIKDYMNTCKQELTNHADMHKHDIMEKTDAGKQEIKEHIDTGKHEIKEQTDTGKQEIKEHIDTGKHEIKEQTDTGKHEIKEQTDTGKQEIQEHIDAGKHEIKEQTDTGKHEIKEQTDTGKHEIKEQTDTGKQEIQEHIDAGKHEIKGQTDTGKHGIKEQTNTGKHEIKEQTDTGKHEIKEQTDTGKQEIKEHIDTGKHEIKEQTDTSKHEIKEQTDTGKQEIQEHIDAGKQEIKEQTDIGKQEIKEHIDTGKQEIKEQTDLSKQEIQEYIDTGKQDFDEHANKRIRDINEQFENTGFNETSYKQSCEDMLGKLLEHYSKRFCHVNTFPLDDYVQEKLRDIYMPPNIQLMDKERGFFKKTGRQISTYQHILLSDTKPNQQIFIQGEAGSGKSTFLAKLVMDWCKITSEQSSVTMLPIDGKTSSVNSNTQMRDSNVFDDLTCLNGFKFVFHIQLRESVDQFDIAKIIKKQIVDSIYSSEEDRGKAYILLNEIMKRERCLVLLDGLDEWIGTGKPGEIGTRHNLPKLADVHSHYCVLLITTRPWKMIGAKIRDSQIDKLMQLDGVDDVFELSRKILGCRKDCKQRQDLDTKQSKFELYVQKYDLLEHLYSPMMLCLIVQLWAEGTELKGSKCEMYSFFLDSLFKKATSERGEFQEPTCRCFTGTQYMQPNIEHLNRLAEAAFDLLFSGTLIFTTKELKKYNLGKLDQNNVALKSGILSAKRRAPTLGALESFSFIHESIQEFLAAYHIFRITHLNLIVDVISRYLDRHEDAYLAVSQVFIFLCGLDIMSANKLSGMMDERNNARVKSYFDRRGTRKLCDIILQGYREAVANEQTNIALTISHLELELDSSINDVRDLHSVWKNNTRNLLSLSLATELPDYVYDDDIASDSDDDIVSDSDDDIASDSDDDIAVRGGSPATAEPTSHIEFDMSSCHRLEYLALDGTLDGNGIWFKGKYTIHLICISRLFTKGDIQIVSKRYLLNYGREYPPVHS